MKDPNLTAPDLVESDFSAAGLQYAKNDKGQMLSLPWSVDYFILYYNKELFAEEGRRRPEDLRRDGRGRRKAHRRQGRHLRLRRARPAQRQHDAVDQLLPQLRRRIPRRQGQHPDRRPGGDRGDEALPDAADQGRASRRRRLQLDGVDGLLHARPRRDVDRRRRLGAAAGRPDCLAHRRQGRLRGGAGRTEGTVFGDLRRRHRHRRREQEQGSRLSAAASGRSRRRRARGCCRPAAACRSATRSSTTPKSARA